MDLLNPLPRAARTALAVLPGLLACALVGCASNRAPHPPQPPPAVVPLTDVNSVPGAYLPVERATADGLKKMRAPADPAAKIALIEATEPESAPKKRVNVLAIAGGGQYGAYAAGLLLGWTARGDRPQFDVITGISSGALIATLAYMGPKYDPIIQNVFTNLNTEDLFKYKPIVVHVLRDKAISSSKPLKQMLERYINDEFIADMKAAHCAGRRLYVGTMDIHTRRTVYWDLGAIAASGRPNARCEVITILLAAASIGGLAPPVPIDVTVDGATYTEFHADGGGNVQAFIRLGTEAPKPGTGDKSAHWLDGSNLYVVAGGKLYPDPNEGKLGLIKNVVSNVSGSLYAIYRADLWRLHTFCAVSGMKFHHAAVPQDFETAKSSTSFDPVEQKKLFNMAYEEICGNRSWRPTPPGYEPSEFELPRAGFDFQTTPVLTP